MTDCIKTEIGKKLSALAHRMWEDSSPRSPAHARALTTRDKMALLANPTQARHDKHLSDRSIRYLRSSNRKGERTARTQRAYECAYKQATE